MGSSGSALPIRFHLQASTFLLFFLVRLRTVDAGRRCTVKRIWDTASAEQHTRMRYQRWANSGATRVITVPSLIQSTPFWNYL